MKRIIHRNCENLRCCSDEITRTSEGDWRKTSVRGAKTASCAGVGATTDGSTSELSVKRIYLRNPAVGNGDYLPII